MEAAAIGYELEGDVRIVLFVVLSPNLTLDGDLISKISYRLRTEASARHVPWKIVRVSDIPRTMNGKVAEVAVREAAHGRPVVNIGALANPECLTEFFNRPELASAACNDLNRRSLG
jgi:acetoacetyl-CoA synthetase